LDKFSYEGHLGNIYKFIIPMWKRSAKKEILEATIGAVGNT